MQFSALTAVLEFASSSQLAFNKGECSQVNFYETYELTDCSIQLRNYKMQTMWLYYSWLTALLPLHGSYRILAALPLALDCMLNETLHQSVLHNRKSGYYHLPSPKQNSLLCLFMMHWRIILSCYLCVSSIQCIGVYSFIDLNND